MDLLLSVHLFLRSFCSKDLGKSISVVTWVVSFLM